MKRFEVALGLAVLVSAAFLPTDVAPRQDVYYPPAGDAWEHRAPESVGLDSALIAQAVEYARTHDSRSVAYDFSGHEETFGALLGPLPESRGGPAGVILRHGYIVAEWGDIERPDLCFSATKSLVSTMVGLAYDDGLIRSVQDPVGAYIDDGNFDSPHNRQITWEHLLQQTSEWEGMLFGQSDTADLYHRRDREVGRQAPGTYYEYNDVRVNLASYSAMMLFRRSLPEVLEERLMDPIGASDTWTWHGYGASDVDVDGKPINSVSGGGHWGGGLWISARDMARFGYLFLRNGHWDGEQLISAEWIALATTPSALRRNYGYMWWLEAEEDAPPGTPVTVFSARGYGSNVIWIDKEHDLVAVLRWFGGSGREFFGPLVQAVQAKASVGSDR
jgi:CubicO group peptidase (beta-lactamase class C family)